MLNTHEQTPHFVSETQIKQLLYSLHDVLNEGQRELLKEELSEARADGKISSYHLHKVLKSLRAENKISEYEQKAIEEAFSKIFEG